MSVPRLNISPEALADAGFKIGSILELFEVQLGILLGQKPAQLQEQLLLARRIGGKVV